MSDSIGRRRFLKEAGLVGAAALTPPVTGAARAGTVEAAQSDPKATTMETLTPDDIRKLLGLEPHATCGYVRITFESSQKLAAGTLPAPLSAARMLGSALYFMVTPERGVRLHRIRNDQLYHYYLGDPIEVLMLRGGGESERVIVGPNLRDGHHVQLLIPGNTFHTARLLSSGQWFLGASTEWPGVIPTDVEIGNLEALASEYPKLAADLRAFDKPYQP